MEIDKPTIDDFTNSQHDHSDAANGGTLNISVSSSNVVDGFGPGDIIASMAWTKSGWLKCDGGDGLIMDATYSATTYENLCFAVEGAGKLEGEGPLTVKESVGTATNSGSNTYNLPSHGLNDDEVVFLNLSAMDGHTWGSESDPHIIFPFHWFPVYVINSNSGTFQVSETKGGSAITHNNPTVTTEVYTDFVPPDLRGRTVVGADQFKSTAGAVPDANRITTTYYGATDPSCPGQAGGSESNTHNHETTTVNNRQPGSASRVNGISNRTISIVQPSMTVNYFIKY